MGHTNDRSTKASSLVNPTSLNLQPRPFAPLESDEKEEAVSRKSGYSENFLEKIINTPSSESATPVQRKSGNRLKAIAAERANAALQNQSIQRQEAVEEEKSEGEQKDGKEFTMNPEPPPVQRKFENRLRAKNAQKMAIQAKLAIGEPNDKYEQEADATAARVVQQINSPMTSQDQPVQRKFENQLRAKNAQKMAIQAKLAIGEPNDKYEQEADANAARVVQQINSSTSASTTSQSQPVQRQGMEEDEELQMKPLVQRRENIGGGEASTDLESSIQSARGGGQSLDANLQQSMGQAMGADFSGVKVHTDSQSDQLNKSIQAKAFTTGQDVFFRQGAYEPSSRGGQELIAHELTHVVQQNRGVETLQRLTEKDTTKAEWIEIQSMKETYKRKWPDATGDEMILWASSPVQIRSIFPNYTYKEWTAVKEVFKTGEALPQKAAQIKNALKEKEAKIRQCAIDLFRQRYNQGMAVKTALDGKLLTFKHFSTFRTEEETKEKKGNVTGPFTREWTCEVDGSLANWVLHIHYKDFPNGSVAAAHVKPYNERRKKDATRWTTTLLEKYVTTDSAVDKASKDITEAEKKKI